ncbi:MULTISPECIES: C40 family peptidase [unclassified Amycolatopsis]|uniref:C40 family peptidase n=1 Tax=unclassified Amycolatopsis TaxID=2618356 RepID=UPI001C69F172|nr:C40 family peptidase [Amycolatopsis sp. DSM 110486]QYN20149.1 C40 family peptidase [Amycolatopsis sp. DSM 110486]
MADKIPAGLGALFVILATLFGSGAGAVLQAASDTTPSASSECTPDGSPTGTVPDLTAEQLTNAAVIVAVGKKQGVPPQGWIIAVATALQESGLRNLIYGDRDSLGLFQQRPSQGWGTPAQITTPAYAAAAFYQRLATTPGWQQMSVTDAAQAVQHSGFPGTYAKHEQRARAIVVALVGVRCQPAPTGGSSGRSCDAIQAPNPAALAAINYACGQRGLPYLWGGNGPQDHGFDCSGLTTAAYRAARITLPRTADAQYRTGPQLPATTPLLPGDLVFYGTVAHVHHVGLYLGGSTMIDAPDEGQVVQIQPYRHSGDDYLGATRPAR